MQYLVPMSILLSADVKAKFPELNVLAVELKGLAVKDEHEDLKAFTGEVIARTKERFTPDDLKDLPIFRAYRDFFWRVGIDPTKIRPAAEALIRRILRGNPPPKINTLVDAYNLASIDTQIALAAFDAAKMSGGLRMRFSRAGEEFSGIDMDKPVALVGNELVIEDDEDLVAVYPYRDADRSKVTTSAMDVLLLVCGVPGIEYEILEGARERAVEYIKRFCGGSLISRD